MGQTRAALGISHPGPGPLYPIDIAHSVIALAQLCGGMTGCPQSCALIAAQSSGIYSAPRPFSPHSHQVTPGSLRACATRSNSLTSETEGCHLYPGSL